MKNEDFVLFPNNYLNIGNFVSENYNKENTIDITQKVIDEINKRDGTRIKKLYVTTEDGTSHYKRNTESLFMLNNFSKLSALEKENAQILSPGVYFSLYQKATMDSKVYRIMRVDGDNVIADYNTINNSGKIITVEKSFKSQDLLGNDSTEGSIARLYMQIGNKKIGALSTTIKNLTKEDTNTQSYQNKLSKLLTKKLTGIFGDIPVELVSKKGNFNDGEHAKIQNGKILINKDDSSPADVVHEYLHLLLSSLKYTNEDAYNYLMENNDLESFDVNAREEEFIKKVSESFNNDSE
jgi:hypothetical protein